MGKFQLLKNITVKLLTFTQLLRSYHSNMFFRQKVGEMQEDKDEEEDEEEDGGGES